MPLESDFEPRSPRYGPFVVSGCWCTLRRFWGFLALFWAVRGHIVELEGPKGPSVTGKSRRTFLYPPFDFIWLF